MAHFFDKRGYSKGDAVALCLENRLDYTSTWIGLGKIGVISGLINTYIRGKSLIHTLETVKSKGVIFSNETEEGQLKRDAFFKKNVYHCEISSAISEVASSMPEDYQYYKWDQTPVDPKYADLASKTILVPDLLKKEPETRIQGKRSGLADCLMYVFTSGTTGLPKAVPLKNTRYT